MTTSFLDGASVCGSSIRNTSPSLSHRESTFAENLEPTSSEKLLSGCIGTQSGFIPPKKGRGTMLLIFLFTVISVIIPPPCFVL